MLFHPSCATNNIYIKIYSITVRATLVVATANLQKKGKRGGRN